MTLDQQIDAMTEAIKAMSEHPANKSHLFVTDDDITTLPCFANDTIFAVKAPQGTTLEVPDPSDAANGHAKGTQRKYRYNCSKTLCEVVSR